jgi:hypothetical protein
VRAAGRENQKYNFGYKNVVFYAILAFPALAPCSARRLPTIPLEEMAIP